MTPPQLAADRPVVDVLHPVRVDLLEVRRHDPGPPLAHRCERALGERGDPDEPLDTEAWLDDRPTAIAVADDHGVRPLALEVAHLAQPIEDRLARLVAVAADELPALGVDPRLLVEHRDRREPVALRKLVVVGVMGRGDLHRTGPEGSLDVLVGDDRQATAQERQDGVAADKRCVALVLGVDGHRRVAEQRLGSGRRDADPRVRIRRAVRPLEVVADGPQRPGLVTVDVLEVADRRQAARAPVDQGFASIDQPGLPQARECRPHRPRTALVHGEALATPVGARPEPSVLAADDLAGLVHELPHALEIPITPQRGSVLPLLGQDAIEDELRGDAGMVDAGQPQGVIAAHAVVANEGVLDGGRQGVTDVQGAGDVRWRLDDDERLRPGVRHLSGAERIGFQPALVDIGLDSGGVIARSHLASRCRHAVRLLRQTTDPLVEGRTGRGTTFVCGHARGRLVFRGIGRTRPARVQPSPAPA